MKTKFTTIFTTAFITLLLGSQAAMASSSDIPSTYKLLLSNGQTAEVLVVKEIKFIDHKTDEVSADEDMFNLDDGA